MSISISKSGWVYKMVDYAWSTFGVQPSKSLCVFFWQMVLAPFMIIAGYGVIAFVIGLFAFGGFYLIGNLIAFLLQWILPNGWYTPGKEFNWHYILLSVIFWLTFLAGIGLRIYSNYRHQMKIEEGTYQPSVVLEFIKAKKKKICPFIEFK